jgi:hypothetical protein
MKCLLELDRFPLTWEDKLAYLTFKFASNEQTLCPVTHTFKNGWYVREMFIPKETLFIGRKHRHGHRCELVSGNILHVTEFAKRHLEAPFEFTTTPGYQMVLYAKTDVVGRTYHPDTGERDTDALERDIFEPVEDLIEAGSKVRQRIHLIEGKAA